MRNKRIKVVDYTRKGRKTTYTYLHLTKWQVFKRKVKKLVRLSIWLLVVLGIIYGIFEAGAYINPKTIITKAEVIKEVEIKAPILEKIIFCESKGKQYDTNGQVLMRSNNNRTVDVGVAQINTVWFAKATELGYDLTKEEDNRAMAMWIYKNKGTSPWYSSSKCWQ